MILSSTGILARDNFCIRINLVPMPLSTADLEGCVESLYRLAECEDDEVLTPSSLAEQLFGARCIQRVPRMIEAGALARAGERRFIGVRASLTGAAAEHVIGHELGHYALNLERYRGDDTERACDYVAADRPVPRRWDARALPAALGLHAVLSGSEN